MTPAQRGLLLLSCPLGDGIRPLSAAQISSLYRRMAKLSPPADGNRELTAADLAEIGCSEELSRQILALLDREEMLDFAEISWKKRRIEVCTRLDPDYPPQLLQKLGAEAPVALFLLGDRTLLGTDSISVVGSRQPRPECSDFAVSLGRLAAKSRLTLVSGDAAGIDRAAQESCLALGGPVVSFICDSLITRKPRKNILYVSIDGPGCRFTAARALSRNRLIHAQSRAVFAIQPKAGTGGTWSGTKRNLEAGWSPVWLFDDGSEAVRLLCEAGASTVTAEQLPALPLFADRKDAHGFHRFFARDL